MAGTYFSIIDWNVISKWWHLPTLMKATILLWKSSLGQNLNNLAVNIGLLISSQQPRRPYCSSSLSTTSPRCPQVCMEDLLNRISIQASCISVSFPASWFFNCLSIHLPVLRWRGDALPLWMERLRHRGLLLLYRHHLPRRRAGVSPWCKDSV